MQQSKARKKDDFLIAFSPVIAEATATAYKGATNEVQQKLRRVVEVWRQRLIFEGPIQESIEARIDELDKSKTSGKRGFGDGGLFSKGPSIPTELAPLVAPQQNISKLGLTTKTTLTAANTDYGKIADPSGVPPSAPVHAARLNGLLKTLANAEGAVAESIKARLQLIEGLGNFLESNRSALAREQEQLSELSSRRNEIDSKKHDVEDAIMKGFATTSNPTTPTAAAAGQSQSPGTPEHEIDRPEVEELTPPPFEGAGEPPVPEPKPEAAQEIPLEETATNTQQRPEAADLAPVETATSAQSYAPPPMPVGSDLLASLSTGTTYNGDAEDGGPYKKRKLSGGDDFPDLGGDAMDGIDDEVAEMLRKDSTGPV